MFTLVPKLYQSLFIKNRKIYDIMNMSFNSVESIMIVNDSYTNLSANFRTLTS